MFWWLFAFWKKRKLVLDSNRVFSLFFEAILGLFRPLAPGPNWGDRTGSGHESRSAVSRVAPASGLPWRPHTLRDHTCLSGLRTIFSGWFRAGSAPGLWPWESRRPDQKCAEPDKNVQKYGEKFGKIAEISGKISENFGNSQKIWRNLAGIWGNLSGIFSLRNARGSYSPGNGAGQLKSAREFGQNFERDRIEKSRESRGSDRKISESRGSDRKNGQLAHVSGSRAADVAETCRFARISEIWREFGQNLGRIWAEFGQNFERDRIGYFSSRPRRPEFSLRNLAGNWSGSGSEMGSKNLGNLTRNQLL